MSSTARLAQVGPNWFASVMGTGIVATSAATLPDGVVPAGIAAGMWGVAALLLVLVLTATAAQWAMHPVAARAHLGHPVMGHFLGAPAMALMTVGAGALLVGHHLIGPQAAVVLDLVLWPAGTALGLWTLCTVPRRTRRRPGGYAGPAFGGWLMPVVPPMVSAATGALLVPHLAPSLRPAMVAACYLLFAVALVASAPLALLIVRRTMQGRVGPAATVPTLFIVVGPLGQSATAAHALGEQGGQGAVRFGVAYGLPVLVAAVAWLGVAAHATLRAARRGLPFGLAWWSFTFPVGTVVTGAAGLAAATGWAVLEGLAVVLFAVLVVAWAIVATGTVRGVLSGELLRPPQDARTAQAGRGAPDAPSEVSAVSRSGQLAGTAAGRATAGMGVAGAT